MRFHLLSRPLAVAAILVVTPALAPAQSASFNFANTDGGFSSVDYPAGNAATAWAYGTPAFQSANVWAISNQGQNGGSAFGLQSPPATITVMTAGQVTGSLTHRFSFGTDTAGGEGQPVYHDGGIIQYRVNGTGGWVTLGSALVGTGGTLGYANSVLISSTDNPLGGMNGFGGRSPGYNDSLDDLTNFTLGDSTAAQFQVGDHIELRFVAGFSGDEFTSNDDPNWQISSVSLYDSSPVPEPGGVLGAAAVALVAIGLRRRKLAGPLAEVATFSRRRPAS